MTCKINEGERDESVGGVGASDRENERGRPCDLTGRANQEDRRTALESEDGVFVISVERTGP